MFLSEALTAGSLRLVRPLSSINRDTCSLYAKTTGWAPMPLPPATDCGFSLLVPERTGLPWDFLGGGPASSWENEISGSISSSVSCITDNPGSGPGQSECSSSASPSSLPSLCSASQSLELLKLLLHPPSSISMRSRPAAPSSPRLTVLLLPLLSTSPDSTLFSLALLFLFPGVTA